MQIIYIYTLAMDVFDSMHIKNMQKMISIIWYVTYYMMHIDSASKVKLWQNELV